MSVDIFNNATVLVKISEGAGGVFRILGLIDPGQKFVLRVDMNLTYREYLLTTKSGNLPVGSSLTSDDVLEYSSIEIKERVIPGDGPVWIKTLNAKRRGVLNRLWRGDPLVDIQIVNSLTNQDVKIVEQNEVPTIPNPTTADHEPVGQTIPPGETFSLPVDQVDPNDTHCYYHLTTSPDNSPIGQFLSDELKKLSKIEITNTRIEYYWQGISSVPRGGSSVAN